MAQPPDSASFYESAYHRYRTSHRYADAVHAATRWTLHDSLSSHAMAELATALTTKGQIEEAAAAYKRAIALDSTHAPLYYSLARFYQQQGDDISALRTFEQLFQIDSSNAFFYRRGAILASAIRRTWLAMKWHEKAIALEPNEPENYLAYAETWMDMRGYGPADSLLRHARRLQPNHRRAIILSARSAYVQGDYADVVRLLEPLYPAELNSAALLRYYGIALYHEKRYEEALPVLHMIAALAPDLDYPHYYIGLCFKSIGKMDEARRSFEKAIECVSVGNLAAYHEALALLHQQEGRHPDAVKHLRISQTLQHKQELLYYLALSYDAYYSDRDAVLRAYERYATTADTAENPLYRHSLHRIETLKREAHFRE